MYFRDMPCCAARSIYTARRSEVARQHHWRYHSNADGTELSKDGFTYRQPYQIVLDRSGRIAFAQFPLDVGAAGGG